ncbi:MAG: oxygen-independent coproporphyrinogen oxidase, partial [Bacillota bacterium]|nr:oxygen-independent coproporphyrinogen oxidase [Bacillota bacterium]
FEGYIRADGSPVVWNHINSREDSISEYLFTGLRRIAGVDLNDFQKVFGEQVKDVFSQNWTQIEQYKKDGYLIYDGNQLRFTEKGIDISNTILTEFIF